MSIDLNSDLAEGIGDELDEQLLKVVTSANVACGGHAGDAKSMDRVTAIAAERGVAVGAHISYNDRAGFGRRSNGAEGKTLQKQLLKQMLALESAAKKNGTAVTYVKPHGELYHVCSFDPAIATTMVDTMKEFRESTGHDLAVLCLPDSELIAQAEAADFLAFAEAFADRAYTADGKLVPRTEPGAVITEPNEAIARLKRLVRDGEIQTIDGSTISVKAQSVCVHGDTPGAVNIARRVRAAIEADRVRVLPFAPPPRQQ